MKHLKQQLLMVLFVASGLMSFAQVGVGTTDPKASLDVSGDAATATSVDGIIAPRLTGDQLKAKDAVYTTDQNGAIVYVTAAVGTSTAKTINVTAAGYYYYDSTVPVWKSIGGGSASSAGLVANRVAISSITAGANGVYTVTDSNTPSAAGSPILATYEDAAGNVTSVNINNRTAGTSFDVTFAATPDAAGFLNYVFPTANVNVVTGTTGPAGPAGATGTAGATGASGPAGAAGAAGTAATVTVGTVSTLAAGATPTVSNSGTTAAAVLDFGFAVASVLKGTQATDGTNAAFTISNTNISATSVVTVSYQNSSNEIINHAITAIAAGSFTVQFAATPASGGKILYTVVN